MTKFNYQKTTQALTFLASLSQGKLNKMKALKFIWLADRYFIRNYGRMITGDDYYALKNGPVASGTRNILELNNNFLDDDAVTFASDYIEQDPQDVYSYQIKKETDFKYLSKAEQQTLNLVHSKFNSKDQFALSDYSHLFPEWKKHELRLNSGLSSRVDIDLRDFFENTDDPENFFIEKQETLEDSLEDFTTLIKHSSFLNGNLSR
jgi:hypothetical protein